MVKLNRLTYFCIRKLGLGFILLRFHNKSALKEYGWFKSFRAWKPIDNQGLTIPWLTYSFIDFLKPRLKNNMRVLEYGSGASTIWLGAYVKEVISIENNDNWVRKITPKLPLNTKILLVSDLNRFIPSEQELGKFDILIIDALGNRLTHIRNSIHMLNDYGIVIWDNTNGLDWKDIYSTMTSLGFKEISFTGMIPQEVCFDRTTLFYRKNNCFDI